MMVYSIFKINNSMLPNARYYNLRLFILWLDLDWGEDE